MPLTRTKVTLPDSMAATKIDGLGTTSVYLRVKKIDAYTQQNGALMDTVIKAQAYAVDATGATVLDALEAPTVTTVMHGSVGNQTTALAALSLSAQNAFIAAFGVAASVSAIPDNIPV